MGTTVIIHLTDEQAAELESMAEETRVRSRKLLKRPSPAISQPDGEPNDQKDKLLTRSDGQRGFGITWPSGGRKKSSPRTSSPGGWPCRAPGPLFVQDPEPAIVKRRQQPRGSLKGRWVESTRQFWAYSGLRPSMCHAMVAAARTPRDESADPLRVHLLDPFGTEGDCEATTCVKRGVSGWTRVRYCRRVRYASGSGEYLKLQARLHRVVSTMYRGGESSGSVRQILRRPR